jgi:hypothetical protein
MRPAADRAPSTTLPLRYLLAAAGAFVLSALGVVWLAAELAGHYYHPWILALTHTFTLGWIGLTIFGSSYQLVPVVLDRPLWSERLAAWQFVLLVAGITGMVAHFALAEWSGLVWAAGLVGVGVGLHVLNTVMTVRGLRRWTFTAYLVAGAITGLGLTTVFGLALGVHRLWPFLPGQHFPTLHAHFHLALLGWILPMVIGVAARVYPMFLLAREPEGWPGRVQLWGLATGVPAVIAGLLAMPALLLPGALAVAAAVAAHLAWVGGMVRSRRRPSLDWGLRFALTGAAFLVPTAAMGLAFAAGLLAGPRLGLAYAVLALGGWVSLTIVGMMLKIVPFLVWYRTYARLAGRVPVPTLPQLSWPAAEAAAYALLAPGMLALAAALAAGEVVWIRAAGITIALGALAFAAALGRVLGHLGRAGLRDAAPAAGVRAAAS